MSLTHFCHNTHPFSIPPHVEHHTPSIGLYGLSHRRICLGVFFASFVKAIGSSPRSPSRFGLLTILFFTVQRHRFSYPSQHCRFVHFAGIISFWDRCCGHLRSSRIYVCRKNHKKRAPAKLRFTIKWRSVSAKHHFADGFHVGPSIQYLHCELIVKGQDRDDCAKNDRARRRKILENVVLSTAW